MSSIGTSLQNCPSNYSIPSDEFTIPRHENHPTESLEEIVLKVCLAENIDSDSDVEDTHDRPEVAFDFKNPQNLDLDGLDWQQTYRTDEQQIQKGREFLMMKRELDKRELNRDEPERYAQEKRDKKFKFPDLFDINQGFEKTPVESVKSLTPEVSVCSLPVSEHQSMVEENVKSTFEYWRIPTKPHNVMTLEMEAERRLMDLRRRLDLIEEREIAAEKARLEQEKEHEENLGFLLGQEDFEAILDGKVEGEEFRDIIVKERPAERVPRRYPNAQKELPYIRRLLNREKREQRDRATVREQTLGKPNIHLEADNVSLDIDQMSEQASDSEDGLSVGYKSASRFQVRGFHDTLSREPRGAHRRDLGGTVKTCMTRDEWIQSIFTASKPKKTYQINTRTKDPNDDRFNIFNKDWQYRKPIVDSPVKQYIAGGKSIIAKPVDPKIKPTPRRKQQKFNLVKYFFENKDGHSISERSEVDPPEYKVNVLEEARRQRNAEKCERRRLRRQRLRVLGIPFLPIGKVSSDVQSAPSDNDWVPKLEPVESTIAKDPRKDEANMQAPEYREPTLRQHPRRPRIYDGKKDLEIPRMQKLSADKVNQSNLEEPKNEESKFKGRTHHDHKDATQIKMVRVKYVPKREKFDGERFKVKKPDENLKVEVTFPIRKNRDRDRSKLTEIEEIEEEIKEVEKEEMIDDDFSLLKSQTSQSSFQQCINTKFKHHIVDALGGTHELPYEYPQASAYREQVLKEQDSIDACLSSASSSECTHFTNDSGSFFLFFGKKVPMDFFTKDEVPYKKEHENHMQAEVVTQRDEYYGPYFVVPYAGQGKEMREMCQAKDKFYTQQTRARVGIKDRIKFITPEPVLVGRKPKQFEPRYG